METGGRRISARFRKTVVLARAKLERKRSFQLVKRVADELAHHDAVDRAGAVAFFAFLSIFPLLLGVISLLGFFLPQENVRQAVSEVFNQILPGSPSAIEENINKAILFRGPGGMMSLAALLWSGSNMFSAIHRAVNRAWDVRVDYSFVPRKLRDLLMVSAALMLLIFSMILSNAIAFAGRDDATIRWLLTALGNILGFIMLLLVFMLLYKYLPNIRRSSDFIWLPGTVLAAVSFQIGTRVFFIIVANADYESVYGTFGSVVIMLLWMYISAFILVVGIEVNSELFRMRHDTKRVQAVPPAKT